MKTNNICNKTRQDENSYKAKDNLEGNVSVCAINSSESFHTAKNNLDKLNVMVYAEASDTAVSYVKQDEHSDLEYYITAQDQLDDSETSDKFSQTKKRRQTQGIISIEQPPYKHEQHLCRSPNRKSRDSSLESRKKRQSPSSRSNAEQRQDSHKFQPVAPEFPNYMNPTYEYSEHDDGWVTSLGRAYIAQHHGQPTAGNVPKSQHKVRTGSTTHSHSSRSPVSLRSQNSSKSNTPCQMETSSTTRNGTNRSPLPVGFSKTSTPYKSQPSNTYQGYSSRTALPAGTAASSSKTGTPHKLPSHNTSMQSESVVCRICHDGDGSEVLISPCYCAGSMGLLHVSCLQRWLGSSNKTSCEICNFEFALQKKAMPISQFLKQPGTAQDKRNLICDLACFLMITPLTIVVTWICIHGAVEYYANSQMEKSGLIGLAVSLLLLYAVWMTIAVRHNWRMWKDWKMFHQEVTLLCTPSPIKESQNHTTGNVDSRSVLGSIHLQSIKVSVQGPMTRCKGGKRNKRRRRAEGKQGTSDRTSDTSGRRSHDRDQIQTSHATIPSVSQNIHNNTQYHEGGYNRHGERRPKGCHGRGGQNMRNCYVNEDNQYYNSTERREVKDQCETVGRKHSTEHNYSQHDNKSHRSCKGSSECSSTFSGDNRRRRKLRADMSKPKRYNESNPHDVYSNNDGLGLSTGANSTNIPHRHRSNDFVDEANTAYVNTIYSHQGRSETIKSVREHASVHRRNAPVENKSRDSLQDFITKWVNDQTKVLAREHQQIKGQESTDSGEVATEVVPGTDIYPRQVTRSGDIVKTTENERDHAMIRKPASLSISSSDISFEQIMKENNLASSSHVSDNERQFTHPTDTF